MPRDFQFPAERSRRRVVVAADAQSRRARVAAAPPVSGHRPAGARRDDRSGATGDGVDRAAIARENPESNTGWGVTLVPAHEQVVGKIGDTLWVLFGAVVLVLVIACANIANLLLARSASAAKGFALCAAFGAGRWALVRRSLVESSMLTARRRALSGCCSRGGGRRCLRPLIPPNVPRADSIGLDLPVLALHRRRDHRIGLALRARPGVARDAAQPARRPAGSQPRSRPPAAPPGGCRT